MSQLERRDVLKNLLVISAAGALTACGGGESSASGAASATDISFAKDGEFFSAKEMVFLTALAQTIIPKTNTAGAVEAGVPEALQGLASEWGDDDFRRYWRKGTQDLQGVFSKKAGQAFEKISAAQRENALSRYDADVFGGKIENEFYRNLKSTIVQAYYMSEPGASDELAYEAVPGDWKGCVPLSDYPKTWAT